jgi:hypothetical protein
VRPLRAAGAGLVLAALAVVAPVPPAAALVAARPDPERHEHAPPDDPGFAHVGKRGITSAIYLGDGWVITARHSQVGEVSFDGHTGNPVAGSEVLLVTPASGGKQADLVMFRIEPAPDLPPLELPRRPPPIGAPAVMVGYGGGATEPIEWEGARGFAHGPPGVKRWGTNAVGAQISDLPGPADALTRCFQLWFDAGASPDESQAVRGDSGGAVFARGPSGGWELAGVMVSVGVPPAQPAGTAMFGNATNAADLSAYRAQILAAIGRPDPEETEPPVAGRLP